MCVQMLGGQEASADTKKINICVFCKLSQTLSFGYSGEKKNCTNKIVALKYFI